TTPSRKVMLELLECSTTDYSTNEVQKQITDQELKQAEEIEEFIENRHKEVIVKKVIDSLVQNKENPMMISFGPDSRSLEESLNETNSKEENIYSLIWALKSKNISSSILQKSEVYNFTLWDIPKEVQHGKTKAVYVQLISKVTSRIEALKKAWAIHFEREKTVCISLGKFNSNTIQERKKFYAIIKNLPKDALELSMLRQFKNINAKMVYIPENIIRHQRLERTAHQKELNGNRAVENQRNKNQQERMIKSLLNKLFKKVTINKYISRNGLNNKIVLDPEEVKLKVNIHFQNQFKKRRINLAAIPSN
ncbi:1716_t:CDS:2, partial [Gigaspora margarita]